MVGIGKCLNRAVIRNSNGLMSPFHGAAYDIFHIRHPVHITHFCMTMKFYPPFRPGIHPMLSEIGNFLDPLHTSDGQLTVKTVNRSNTPDFNKHSLFYCGIYLLHLIISRKHFHNNSVGEVRQFHHNDGLFPADLSGLQVLDLTAHRHLAHLTGDLFQRDGILLKITSYQNIRVV